MSWLWRYVAARTLARCHCAHILPTGGRIIAKRPLLRLPAPKERPNVVPMLGGLLIRVILRSLGLIVAAILIVLVLEGPEVFPMSGIGPEVLAAHALASPETRTELMDAIFAASQVTLPLFSGALIVALLIGLPLGIRIGKRAGGVVGALLGFLLHLPVAIPIFWLGLVVLHHALPNLKGAGEALLFPGWSDPAQSALLLAAPMLMLGLAFAARFARNMQWHVGESVGGAHIDMARAKGLTRRRALARHGVGPSLAPMLTSLKRQVTTLASATLVIEVIFDLPGFGPAMFDALKGGQQIALAAHVLVLLAGITLCHLVIEIARAPYTPRVRGAA